MTPKFMTDLTEHFEHMSRCIAAHGRATNMLILWKLKTPYRRSDGKHVGYAIEYRWLSCDVTEPESWTCVKGSEFTYWSRREIKETGFDFAEPEKTPLVDCFDLF